MKLYSIDNENSPGIAAAYLKKACEALGVQYVSVIAEEFDATNFEKPASGDALFRISTDKASREVEKFLINESVATFYDNSSVRPCFVPPAYLALKDSEVPMPKTISISTQRKDLLEKYANALGGFPLIVKVVGGTQGIGVIKVDSLQAMFSLVDYLNQKKSNYILREFIDTDSSARLVVVGDKVVASIEYKASGGDFRSNNKVRKEDIAVKEYSSEIQKAAVDAVKLKGLEFGGVDVLFDKSGKHYVLEANFPFAFPEVQKATGIDIAEKMVLHLQSKEK